MSEPLGIFASITIDKRSLLTFLDSPIRAPYKLDWSPMTSTEPDDWFQKADYSELRKPFTPLTWIATLFESEKGLHLLYEERQKKLTLLLTEYSEAMVELADVLTIISSVAYHNGGSETDFALALRDWIGNLVLETTKPMAFVKIERGHPKVIPNDDPFAVASVKGAISNTLQLEPDNESRPSEVPEVSSLFLPLISKRLDEMRKQREAHEETWRFSVEEGFRELTLLKMYQSELRRFEKMNMPNFVLETQENKIKKSIATIQTHLSNMKEREAPEVYSLATEAVYLHLTGKKPDAQAMYSQAREVSATENVVQWAQEFF